MIIKRFMSYFPSMIPTGLTEFTKWSTEIIELAGPLADEDSMRWVIAAQVQHIKEGKKPVDRLPKQYFVAGLRRGAANQVASQVFYDIKTKQEAAKAKAIQDAAEAAALIAQTPVQESAAQGVE